MIKMKSKKFTLVKYLSKIAAMSLLMLFFACNQKVVPRNQEKSLQHTIKSHQMEKDLIYTIVDEKPEFIGGNKAMLKYLSKNVKYPTSALKKGIQGRVYVRFVIDKEGNVKDAKILRSVDPALDKEALRLIKSMPKWKPGKHKGNPVNTYYNVPINFVL